MNLKITLNQEMKMKHVMFFLAEDKGIAALPPSSLHAELLLITDLCRVVVGSKLQEASAFFCQDNFDGSK